MDQKVTIRFWWEFALSYASWNHLTTFADPPSTTHVQGGVPR